MIPDLPTGRQASWNDVTTPNLPPMSKSRYTKVNTLCQIIKKEEWLETNHSSS